MESCSRSRRRIRRRIVAATLANVFFSLLFRFVLVRFQRLYVLRIVHAAVMLSGETANGEYPVESCRVMKNTVLQADLFLGERRHKFDDYEIRRELDKRKKSTHVSKDPRRAEYINEFETVARAAVDAARDFEAPLILVLTKTGLTAKLISAHRPDIPVMCVTNSKRIGRQLQLYRSLVPCVLPVLEDDEGEKRVDESLACAKQMGLLSSGDKVVVVYAQQKTPLVSESIGMKITTLT